MITFRSHMNQLCALVTYPFKFYQTNMNVLKITTLLLLTVHIAYGQDNTELQQMAEADQQARMGQQIDWAELNKQDSLRRARATELLDAGLVKTAKDFYNTGIIFQHGNDTVASGIAVDCFKKAIEMDSTLNRWWYAAAVDRDLMRKGEPQIYGTQFIADASTQGKFMRYKMDPDRVTDEERRYYGVETLAEQAEKERLMNLKQVGMFYMESNSIEKTLDLIRSEFKKGDDATYNTGEQSLNAFGYGLLNQGLDNEALAVFELNTQLYPTAFNTYDSYGEALRKVGRIDEAIDAYQKSLALNPDNDNAENVLRELLPSNQ